MECEDPSDGWNDEADDEDANNADDEDASGACRAGLDFGLLDGAAKTEDSVACERDEEEDDDSFFTDASSFSPLPFACEGYKTLADDADDDSNTVGCKRPLL